MDRHHARRPPSRPLVLIVDGHDDTGESYAIAPEGQGVDNATAQPAAALTCALGIHAVIVSEVGLPARERPDQEGCATVCAKPGLREIVAHALRDLRDGPSMHA